MQDVVDMCNTHATCVQHACNMCATRMQHVCKLHTEMCEHVSSIFVRVPTYLPTESLTFSLIYVGRSIKTHLYWAMKNCGEDPDKLCALIMNIADHYQVCIITVCTLWCMSLFKYREGCND